MPQGRPIDDAALIPLFPLPRTVLFPYTDLPLYIFEPRYKEMIRMCIRDRCPFGVLLLRSRRPGGSETAGVCRVGGTGEVVRHEVVGKDGEMQILVHGTGRFRVTEFVPDRAYLRGRVRPLVAPPRQGAEGASARERIRAELRRMLTFSAGPLAAFVEDDEADVGVLADRVVDRLAIDPGRKQAFLETIDPVDRAEKLCRLLRTEGGKLGILDGLIGGDPSRFQVN